MHEWSHRSAPALMAGVLVISVLLSHSASAHGTAGKRFFPTTFQVEDPFVSDELSFLSSFRKEPASGEEPALRAFESSAELSKRITRKLGITLEGEFRRLDPVGGSLAHGFGNLGIGARYQFLGDGSRELVGSIGLQAEVGGTGDAGVEAEPFSTLSPGVFLGKGFGDLPASLRFLRPLAVTAALSARFPTEGKRSMRVFDPELGAFSREVDRNPVSLDWGLSFQYNLGYLSDFVKDIGLPAPLRRMVPVVEFSLDSCLNRGCSGVTTGTVNPGLIWVGRFVQLGVAAQVPLSDRTGHQVGGLFLVHVFVDDLFPRSLGRPLIGD